MSTSLPTATDAPGERRRPRSDHPGPPLGVPAAAFVVFFLAGILAGPISGAGTVPAPDASVELVRSYFSAGGPAVLGGFFLFVGSVALMVFGAITLSRLQFLAPNAPGPLLGGLGCVAAALLLALSGLLQLTLFRPAVLTDPALVQALQYLMFVTGGPAHTAALGVAVIGIAVTTHFLGRLPRWVPTSGVVIGVIAVLACLAIADPALTPVVPVGRFLSMIWIVTVALLLPRGRGARRTAETS